LFKLSLEVAVASTSADVGDPAAALPYCNMLFAPTVVMPV
jgi:hypothetical protein